MNILLTSVGRRSYLIKYFQEALGTTGEVHVANSSAITPSFLAADHATVTPLIYDEDYIPFLLQYCQDHQIQALISLFDIDLPILAAYKERFRKAGIQVVVSDQRVIDTCNDKWKSHQFLKEHGFQVAKTYLSLADAKQALVTGELAFPVIIKPRWGMGSIAVYEAENESELEILYQKTLQGIQRSYLEYESVADIEASVLIQEKLQGQEYGLDVINDLDGRYQNTIVKKKHAMRSGETDCAETMANPVLEALGQKLSAKLGHIANLDTDVFLVEGQPYILEMNARFGGGYPFSHMAGANLPQAIVNWLKGKSVNPAWFQAQPGLLLHKDITLVDITAVTDR